MAARRFTVQSGAESRTVELGANGLVTVNGSDRQMSVHPVGVFGEYEVRDGLCRRRIFVAGPAEAREVFVDGQVFRFEVASADQRRRKAGAAHADSMTAPMPGTVLRILVEPGQQVKRGDTLIKLEAMKMELPIRAPHDGSVETIHCHEGELVQAGVRLLDLA
jgi:3-methylcrotonyl-CoA carboxylase alpha subunit